MRNDLSKSWQKAFQGVLLQQSESRFAGMLMMFAYFITTVMSLLLTFGSWIWWRSDVALGDGIVMATISLLGHFVMTYETGYKKGFCDGQRRYFYIVWLVPMLLSLIGFIGGLFYRGIL